MGQISTFFETFFKIFLPWFTMTNTVPSEPCSSKVPNSWSHTNECPLLLQRGDLIYFWLGCHKLVQIRINNCLGTILCVGFLQIVFSVDTKIQKSHSIFLVVKTLWIIFKREEALAEHFYRLYLSCLSFTLIRKIYCLVCHLPYLIRKVFCLALHLTL